MIVLSPSLSDEDECVSMPGVCGSARCENVEGSFMCECDRRGEEFDHTTRQCVNTAQGGTTTLFYIRHCFISVFMYHVACILLSMCI